MENPVIEFAKPQSNYSAYQPVNTTVIYDCIHDILELETVNATCQADGNWTVNGECMNKHLEFCENKSPIFAHARTNSFAFGHNMVDTVLLYKCVYDESKIFKVEVK